MGYRLDIVGKKTKKNFYGTKLYGYVNEEQLKSYKYLIEIGKFDGDEFFSYSDNNEIILNKDEFKEFVKLYNEDFNKEEKVNDLFIIQEEIQELLNSDEDKIISWG